MYRLGIEVQSQHTTQLAWPTYPDVLVLLSVTAVLEATAVNVLAPELQLANRFSRSLLRYFLLNVALFGIWRLWIYPFFFSSLRKLPDPKVLFLSNFRDLHLSFLDRQYIVGLRTI